MATPNPPAHPVQVTMNMDPAELRQEISGWVITSIILLIIGVLAGVACAIGLAFKTGQDNPDFSAYEATYEHFSKVKVPQDFIFRTEDGRRLKVLKGTPAKSTVSKKTGCRVWQFTFETEDDSPENFELTEVPGLPSPESAPPAPSGDTSVPPPGP